MKESVMFFETVKYKLKKRIPNAPEDMFIVPDMQEAIVSQAQWDRVQELRKRTAGIVRRAGLLCRLRLQAPFRHL